MSPLILLASLWAALPEPVPRYLPPLLEDRLAYYDCGDAPAFNPGGLQVVRAPERTPDGWAGAGLRTGGPGKTGYTLAGDGLLGEGPLSALVWWRLAEPCPLNGGFQWLSLDGRGYLTAFARGGPWCELKDTASVLQTWNLVGIPNQNLIYDRAARNTLGLDDPSWHHGALVVSGGTNVRWYSDGVLGAEAALEGRALSPDDGLRQLRLGDEAGPELQLDEVAVLNRALTAEEIAAYFLATTSLRALDAANGN